jgi:tRNA A-37 threonylcarbamoyl transferase component Bud32
VVLELVNDDGDVAEAVRRRVRSYAALLASGVPVPRLLDHDVARGYLVKEYLAGANVGETLSHNRLGSGVVDQFGALTRLVKQNGLSIDWSPSNFLVVNGALHYTQYEACLPRPERRAERRAMATPPAA